MRIGQTSAISFGSRIASSLLGAIATFYFARVLGASVLGQYALFLAVLHWMKVGGTTGVSSAITKRVSEGEDEQEFLIAGLLIQFGFLLVFTIPLLLAHNVLNDYLDVSFSYLLIFLLFVDLAFTYVTAVLNGQHKVHISSLLQPVQRALRSGIQIGLVVLGMGLFGILIGYVMAGVIVTAFGLYFVSFKLSVPELHHIRRIFTFVQYSWLGGLKGSVFSWMDTLILSLFVTKNFIGIYEVSWSIASLFVVFGGAIGQAVFPEMSEISNAKGINEIRGIASDALAFTGLFILPGLVGGLIIGDRVLYLYGNDFTQGYVILIVLIIARLFDTYQAQLSNIFNAVDRPDIGFRINAIIIVSNLVLNLVLIAVFGWIGAAVASLISAGLGLAYAYNKTIDLIGIQLPYDEILRQLAAAIIMGLSILPIVSQVQVNRFVPIIIVVLVGAGIYLLVLMVLSKKFRAVILTNLSQFF